MKKLFAWILLSAMGAGGCTTKANARRQAQAAFAAGQQQAFAQVQEARRTSIRVLGSVRIPEIEWAEGLTLVRAIAAAGYTGARDPSEIVVIRQREQIHITPKELLGGNDVPLEPGDTVEIRPITAAW